MGGAHRDDPRQGPRNDVAIYRPAASVYFGGRAFIPGAGGIPQGGGAELQIALLARGLVAQGLRVAVVVWPGALPPSRDSGPELVERRPYSGGRRLTGRLAETIHIWRGMAAADAEVYLFRGSGPQLLVGAGFCRLHRRRLIFAAANDLDFDFDRPDRTNFNLRAYRAALRRADLVVVQREEQLELARRAGLERLELIPSFAEPAEASRAEPEAFLWIGRLVEYKRPLAFVRLAEALPEASFRMIEFETDETPAALQHAVEEADASLENFDLVGQLPHDEVLELTERATAVVSTSEAEGMPNVFLEAWARGVPVISLEYDPDGKIEELGLGLVANGSEVSMREAAASLWRDRELRARLGANARRYVREAHSPPVVTGLWAETIRQLVPPGLIERTPASEAE